MLRDVGLSIHERAGNGVANGEFRTAQTVGDKAVQDVLVTDNQARPHVAVPRTHHFEDGDTDNCRQRQRNHNLPQIFEVACAVHLGCVIQFVGDLHEILTKKIDVEHADKEGNDKYDKRTAPTETNDGCKVGDCKQFAGNHHCCKQCAEHDVFALEFQTGKCKRRKNGDHKAEYGTYDTDVHRVDEQLTEVGLSECLGVVAPQDVLRKERRDAEAVLVVTLQGRDNHPVEGKQHANRHNAQEQIQQHLHDHFHYTLMSHYLAHVALLHGVCVFRHDRFRSLIRIYAHVCFAGGFQNFVNLHVFVDGTDFIVVVHTSLPP